MQFISRMLLVCLLSICSLQATKYDYRISGNTGNPADERVITVDTDSEDFQARLAWISETLELGQPSVFALQNRELVVTLAGTLDPTASPVGVRFGIACWTKDVTSCVDVGSIGVQSWGPTHVLVWLNFELGLGRDAQALGHLSYSPPKPAEPAKDWGTFFQFGYRRTYWGLALSYVVPILPMPGDLDRDQGLTRFTDQYSRRAFHLASAESLAIGVVHSHPEGTLTWPSLLDDDMDTYFARELSAFSRGAPYCSLILQRNPSGGLTFTARVHDRGEWFTVTSMISVGPSVDRYESELYEHPYSVAEDRLASKERLASLLGIRSVDRFQRSTLGVIGCSGTGSPATHVLARAGVGGFVLVDPKRLAPSNHERFHASTHADLNGPAPYKVDLLKRLVNQINPSARVTALAGNILQDNVVDELLLCDMNIGSTDTQHGRAAMSDLASRYLLPSIDVGVLMEGAEGRLGTQLVDVTSFSPELPCGFCSGRIDGPALSYELMPEDEIQSLKAAAQAAIKRGDDPDHYWRQRPRQLHTVGYLTTLAGALAAGYVEGHLSGTFQVPHSSFQFDIGQQRLAPVISSQEQLRVCTCQQYRGWSDCASAYRNVSLPPHWDRRARLISRMDSPQRRLRVRSI